MKTLQLVGVTAPCFGADDALDEVWGWPSRQALPERFVLLAAVIAEPGPKTPGALFAWVNTLEAGRPATRPRAYRLPYTKDLHSRLNDGMKKVRQGVSQMGSAMPRGGPKGLSWLRPGSEAQDVRIRDLPLPQLPEK